MYIHVLKSIRRRLKQNVTHNVLSGLLFGLRGVALDFGLLGE